MKKNLGTADKAIRVIIAIVIAGLYFANLISGTAAIILLAVGVIFLLTSLISFCPIYWLFGASTKNKSHEPVNL